MNTPFNKSFCGKSPLNELTARQEANLPEALKTAIEAKSPTNYGSPLDQLSPTGTPGNVGYYDPEYEAHPSEKLPTRRENQAELDAAKFGLSQAAEIRKTRLTPTTAKQAYDLSKPYFDADSKMRKQKRQDYSDILKAGKTIASALNQNTSILETKPKKKTNEKELS